MLTEVFSVKDHRWQFPEKVKECIWTFLGKQSDGLYEVTIKKITEKRSGNQNRYLWKLCELLSEPLGFQSKDQVLVLLMEECELGHYVQFRDRRYFERKSSAELDKETFGKLIEKAFEIASFLNEDRPPHMHIILPRTGET